MKNLNYKWVLLIGAVLGLIVGKAKELGCDALCALGYKGTPIRRILTRKAFVPVMPRLVGEHIDFSVRLLDGKLSDEFVSSRNWNLTWGDTDLV